MDFLKRIFGGSTGSETQSYTPPGEAEKPIVSPFTESALKHKVGGGPVVPVENTAPLTEEERIEVVKKRTAGFTANSGGLFHEPSPGAHGTGDVTPIVTLNPVEKKQPENTTVDVTDA